MELLEKGGEKRILIPLERQRKGSGILKPLRLVDSDGFSESFKSCRGHHLKNRSGKLFIWAWHGFAKAFYIPPAPCQFILEKQSLPSVR